ncbi:MAG: hypothetical protein J5828_00710 [Desulfovibrionaceae bacterium]|nr:hypothetical protein [Desulfovibrionaceae bacterium]
MPLIKCPDCGQQVSTNAAQCPHCGCPMSQMDQTQIIQPETTPQTKGIKPSKKKKGCLTYIFLLLLVIAAIVVFSEPPKDKADSAPVSIETPSPKENKDPCQGIRTIEDWEHRTSKLFRMMNPQCKPSATAIKKQVRVISASALSAEYEANEVAAEQKYKGKFIGVTGIVDSIETGCLAERMSI